MDASKGTSNIQLLLEFA